MSMPTPMKPWSASDEPKSVSDKNLRAHLREIERKGPKSMCYWHQRKNGKHSSTMRGTIPVKEYRLD